jgi:hypothetical protein
MRRMISLVVLVVVAETQLPCHRECPHGEGEVQRCQSDTLTLTRPLSYARAHVETPTCHSLLGSKRAMAHMTDSCRQVEFQEHLAREGMGIDILYRRRQCLVLIRRHGHGHLAGQQVDAAASSATSNHIAEKCVLAGAAGIAGVAGVADVAEIADDTAAAGVCGVVARCCGQTLRTASCRRCRTTVCAGPG